MKTRHSSPRQILLFAATALLMLFGSSTAMAAAGKVVFVRGEVQLERAGTSQPLAKGARIEAGDTIVTGGDGRVQMLMADGDRMALRTNTRFTVDAFKAPDAPDKPETGRSFYSLVKGGFRAVTRSLGKRGLDSYRVKTPVATIGIRGTTYWVIQYPGDANNPPGFYFGVSDGGLNIGNNAGEFPFQAGQFGYLADMNSAPVLLEGPPSFMQGDEGAGGGGTSGGEDSGGYTGGEPLHGCSSTAAGDFNCPPTQPIQGDDGFDFTPGELPPPTEPTEPTEPTHPPIDEPTGPSFVD